MLKIAICDDYKADSDRIEKFVNEYISEKGIDSQVKVFNHPDQMMEECETFRPHIYILDIVMPMISGIEAARELRWNQKESQIIFTTSEKSFALESFDVNPVNYLLKPVDRTKLFESLDLCLKHIDLDDDKAITVKVKGGFETIHLAELMYLDYRNHVVTFHLLDKTEISTATLRIGFEEYINETLNNDIIVKCHESFAVNIAAIDRLEKTDIILRNKESIPVSKSKYQAVSQSYLDYRFE